MSTPASQRLSSERKLWRKDHPYGFTAKPTKKPDGTLDLMNWECEIPGRENTIWEGGVYKLRLKFDGNYPNRGPHAKFVRPLFHPNVYPCGDVCLSLLNHHWKPTLTIKNILLGIQSLLTEPNPKSPANGPAYEMYKKSRSQWEKRVKQDVMSKHKAT